MPVTAEIIRGCMETICYEMATHVSLTATTPILNQSNERNATILDGRGALAALSASAFRSSCSARRLPVRFALEFFGADGLYDGDVLVANDPYHGGGHLPDYNIFAPVFHKGELVLIALDPVPPRRHRRRHAGRVQRRRAATSGPRACAFRR